MSLPPDAVLALIAMVAFFIRGFTGAASAIVFNAFILVVDVSGISPQLSLLHALYWMAMADALASIVMLTYLRTGLKVERVTLLVLAGLLPATAIFTIVLPDLDVGLLRTLLGSVIMVSGLLMVARPHGRPLSVESQLRLALPTGAAAGVIGGLFGMPGPGLMLLLTRTGGNSHQFKQRITLLSLGGHMMRVSVLGAQGALTSTVAGTFAATIPIILVALAGGLWAHSHVRAWSFNRLLGALIAISGTVAIVQSIRL